MTPDTVADFRPIRIDHFRCGEITASTLVLAPRAWDEGELDSRVGRARRAYLEALAIAASESDPPNDYRWGTPPYSRYPDRKVSDIDAEWAEKRRAYEAWKERQRDAATSFSTFLSREGFLSIHEHALGVDLDWGHRHGTRIDYSETDVDTMPSPARLLGEEDDDE